MRSAVILGACLLGCGRGAPENPTQDLGGARLALGLPTGSPVFKVEYQIRFTFLESDPPYVYGEASYTSVANGGELIAVVPCHTGPDGTGLNQVDIAASIWLEEGGDPIVAGASAVFDCRRNADTAVNVVITVLGGLDAGFADLDAALGGALCASKIDFKNDAVLGVCPDALCQAQGIFLFANYCQTLSGRDASYWLCGDPSDWTLQGGAVISFFPIPERDGRWTFGVIALDQLHMAQADPTLTDAAGVLQVFAGLGAARALLETRDGEVVRSESTRVRFDFGARLVVPPRTAGGPTPELLMTVTNEVLGARVTFQTRQGPCDVPSKDVSLYPGMKVIDVRRVDDHNVDLILSDAGAAWASRRARCEAKWNTSAQPVVACNPPTALAPAGSL